MTALVWFRRDLRVYDHPALVEAVRRHRDVYPVFVVDEKLLGSLGAGRNRLWFMARSLLGLREEIERRGGSLTVRVGPPERVLPELARAHGATSVYVSRDYAPYGRRRDRAARAALNTGGIEWHEEAGVLVHEPEDLQGKGNRVPRTFASFHRRFQAVPRRRALAPPRRISSPVVGGVGVEIVGVVSGWGVPNYSSYGVSC